MTELRLTGLEGSNPLAFLAALGALSVCERMQPGASRPRLAWVDEVVAVPVLSAQLGTDALIDLILQDREQWRRSPALQWPPANPADDVKFSDAELREWLSACAAAEPNDGGRALAFAMAMVAEGSYTDSGDAKPTDLHFTAGRQKFLKMARELRDGLSAGDLEEALVGPWRYDSTLPSMKWDVTDDRVYALSPVDPAGEKKLTVPGAEWLALVGLTAMPVTWRPGRTVTTGCSGRWRQGTFSWPVWRAPLELSEVRTLIGQRDLTVARPPVRLVTRGVTRVFRSVVTRSDQGGYGSFRPPRVVLDGAMSAS